MAPQGNGNKKTPEALVNLLSQAVAKSSQSAVARETGLTQSAIGRYVKGVGQPTTTTLIKLADYFEVSIARLRGDDLQPEKIGESLNTIREYLRNVGEAIKAEKYDEAEKCLWKSISFTDDLLSNFTLNIKSGTVKASGHSTRKKK